MLPALCCLANALAVLAPKSVALVATWNEGTAVHAVLLAASSGHSSLHKYAAWALSNVSTSEEGCGAPSCSCCQWPLCYYTLCSVLKRSD